MSPIHSTSRRSLSGHGIECLEARIAPAAVVGLDASRNLLFFDTDQPDEITKTLPIKGVGTGETIVGIDFRPLDGLLYAVTKQDAVGRIYTLNVETGAAVKVSTLVAAPGDDNPFTGLDASTIFGADFNPVPDRLRLVSADLDANLRIAVTAVPAGPGTPPATPALPAGSTFTDTPLTIGGVAGTGSQLAILGAAYSNPDTDANTGTELTYINFANSSLYVAATPNNGQLTLRGALGITLDPASGGIGGYDIALEGRTNLAIAALRPTGATGHSLYEINTASGAATLLDKIGDGSRTIVDIAMPTAGVSIAASGRSAVYTDVDGDRVTVTTTKGKLTPAMFTLVPEGSGARLAQLNLTNDFDATTPGNSLEGTGVSITARPSGLGGNGFVNVGYINATGFDLGAVLVRGDLTDLDAGNAVATTAAVASLTVDTLGRFGVDTTANVAPVGGGNPVLLGNEVLSITGRLGSLKVAGDVLITKINVGNAGTTPVVGSGSIGAIFIGGSLIGGDGDDTGYIIADGAIASVTIKGGIEGDEGINSGGIFAGGTIGAINIAGDVTGDIGPGSGEIFATGGFSTVLIGGDLVGGGDADDGGGESSGKITGASAKSITIVGNIFGGVGDFSGRIEIFGSAGRISVVGNLIGDDGASSGSITVETATSITIGRSILGGAGEASASILGLTSLGAVTIRQSIDNDANPFSGGVTSLGRIASITVGLNVDGGVILAKSLGTLKIGGTLSFSQVQVLGELLPATAAKAVAIGKVTVGQDVSFSNIQAGFIDEVLLSTFAEEETLAQYTNRDAQIGSILVGRNVEQSSFAAGVSAGADGFFGNGDVGEGPFTGPQSTSIFSRIASITINGQIRGSQDDGESFGFVAQQIGAFKLGGFAVPLSPTALDVLRLRSPAVAGFGETSNVFIREYAGN